MERRSFICNSVGTIAALGLAGSAKALSSEMRGSNGEQFKLNITRLIPSKCIAKWLKKAD